MRALFFGSLAMVACGGSSKPASPPISNQAAPSAIAPENVVGSTTKSETQLAREQAIEQARAAGILRNLGGNPAPPPPPPAGPLDRESIRREVRAHLKPITLCYEQRLLEDATLQGTTTVTLLIGSDGSVVSSTGSGFDAKVDACVADVIKSILFPPPAGGGTMQVNYPFTFRPSS